MDPLFWPLTAHSPTYFVRANADGSTGLPEPYKPRNHRRTTTAKQLTVEEANKLVDDYLEGLEEKLMTEIYNSLNNNKMNTTNSKATPQQAMLDSLNAMSKKVNLALAKTQGPPKAGAFYTADAQLLDFGEKVNELDEVQVGSEATLDGKPAEGEYTMPDGVKLTFKRGKVTEIKGMVKNRLPFKAKRKPSGKRIPFHKPSK